jgi:hypothetical protein
MHYYTLEGSCKYVLIPVVADSLSSRVLHLGLAFPHHNAATVSMQHIGENKKSAYEKGKARRIYCNRS